VNTSNNGYPDRRRRRTHSSEFKAQIVAACRKPGISIAAVALDYRLNANLVRRWVVAEERAEHTGVIETRNAAPPASITATPAFIPVEVQKLPINGLQEIIIELRRGPTIVKVSWPLTAAAACGTWLGELLR
jgi:transposase-like protein